VTAWRLPPEPSSAAVARHLLKDSLDAVDDDVRRTAVLLADELVVNAILHTGGTLTLSCDLDDDQVRIGVCDDAPDRDDVGADELDVRRTSGRGLFLVDALATGWGVEPNDGGKCVWFRLDRQGR
jgi:anti-sigma regulatory factor (Ser/Thr protein kinase)